MKKIQKFLSVILCVLMVFTVCVPAFAAKASPEREEKTDREIALVPEIKALAAIFISAETNETEAVTEHPVVSEDEPVIPEEEGDSGEDVTEGKIDGEVAETETPEDEIPEEEVPEEEDTYFECLKHCLNEGIRNLGMGALFVGGSVCSPVLFFVFPPVGAALLLAGFPFGVVCLFVGIGEIITSPVLALCFDTDDYLALV